jgi:hypothetical protein
MQMKKIGTQALSIIAATLAFAIVTAPVSAKDSKKTGAKPASPHSAAEAAGPVVGDVPETVSSPMAEQQDRKSGPAWRTIGGTVKQIKGDTYTVEDYDGNQVQLYVGQDTKHLRQKRVGDTVRAEITRGGFANSIQ